MSKFISLPGLIDVHVHFREPGAVQKEDFETGTKAAVAGGYTQVLDMPNNIPPTVSQVDLENKIKAAKGRIWCDLGFNFGATKDSTTEFKKIYDKSFGLKVYMNQTTGPLLVDKLNDRELIFKSWKSKLPIMVHAENETVDVAIKLATKYKKKLHICHVSYSQIRSIEKARKNGLKITCEVCPHHLFLNKNDVKRLGPLGLMKPPLLSKMDQENLWDKLDSIDTISTDHAPHTLEEKMDKSAFKYGVPGLETTLPLMLRAVDEKKLTQKKLIEMLFVNPKKIFKLPVQPKTKVIIDISQKFKMSKLPLYTKCQWTPFAHLYGQGIVTEVIIRDKSVYKNGKYLNKPMGKVIYPLQ